MKDPNFLLGHCSTDPRQVLYHFIASFGCGGNFKKHLATVQNAINTNPSAARMIPFVDNNNCSRKDNDEALVCSSLSPPDGAVQSQTSYFTRADQEWDAAFGAASSDDFQGGATGHEAQDHLDEGNHPPLTSLGSTSLDSTSLDEMSFLDAKEDERVHSKEETDEESPVVPASASRPGAVSIGGRSGDQNNNQDDSTTYHPDSGAHAIVAELVSDADRQSVLDQAKREVVSSVVEAEVVTQDPRHRYRYWAGVVFFFIVVVSTLGAVLGSRSPDSSASSAAATPTTSPTLFEFGRVFQSTQQLYDAVDDYVVALLNDTANSSEAALRFGYPMGTWNVSLISDFSRVFDPLRDERMEPEREERYDLDGGALNQFNEDIGDWDVSNAETIRGMFAGATSFSGKGLSKWNVGRVSDFSFAFLDCYNFDGAQTAGWNTSSATDLAVMFYRAGWVSGADIDLNGWDTSKVEDFSQTFDTTIFNGNISAWDTSAGIFMKFMFYESAFNGDISAWDTSAVIDMEGMFVLAAFNGNISAWNTSAVTTMQAMFFEAEFNGDLSGWDTSAVTSMEDMFYRAPNFNGDLSRWNTSAVTTMDGMFLGSKFNSDVSAWSVGRVEQFALLFTLTPFNGDLSAWDVSNGVRMYAMFAESAFNGDISAWSVGRVENMERMFAESSFQGDISGWNVTKVVTLEGMFFDNKHFNRSLCSWGELLPANVTVIDMFDGATSCPNASDPGVPDGPFCQECSFLAPPPPSPLEGCIDGVGFFRDPNAGVLRDCKWLLQARLQDEFNTSDPYCGIGGAAISTCRNTCGSCL